MSWPRRIDLNSFKNCAVRTQAYVIVPMVLDFQYDWSVLRAHVNDNELPLSYVPAGEKALEPSLLFACFDFVSTPDLLTE